MSLLFLIAALPPPLAQVLLARLVAEQNALNSQQILIFFSWPEVNASGFESAVNFQQFTERAFELRVGEIFTLF